MKYECLAIIVCFFFMLPGCSSDSEQQEPYLIRVNDYKISGSDVDALLKFEITLGSGLYASKKDRTGFIKNLIQTQLLLQEARNRKLDRREQFRQSIQRYWESTLIRDLLEEKGRQLRKTTIVSDDEVENFYNSSKEMQARGSLVESRTELVKLIEDKKVTERLQNWIEELRAKADIEITDPELFREIKGESKGSLKN